MAEILLPTMVINRPDGRPEAYDLDKNRNMECHVCAWNGKKVFGKRGSMVLTSPVDSPDGEAHFCCVEHLPDNIVIYDPITDMCRSKNGQNVWRES